MDTWTKPCGPIPGDLILTHTHVHTRNSWGTLSEVRSLPRAGFSRNGNDWRTPPPDWFELQLGERRLGMRAEFLVDPPKLCVFLLVSFQTTPPKKKQEEEEETRQTRKNDTPPEARFSHFGLVIRDSLKNTKSSAILPNTYRL